MKHAAPNPPDRVPAAALAAAVAVLSVAVGCSPSMGPHEAPRLGEPLPGLTEGERGRFLLGRALFERLATPEEGLGPLFNGERCATCHDEPATGGGGTRVLVQKATAVYGGRCDVLAERGGDNIQLRATPLLLAAGFGPEEIPLEATGTALVTAPPLFGLGLLEAIPEEQLLRHEDPGDADGDGVRGRLARLPDGRPVPFGRKGDAATVADFVASALLQELGLTTDRFPVEERRNGVSLPPGTDPASDPETDPRGVALLTDFIRFLAPPAPEIPESREAADSIRKGEEVFRETGCERCHVSTFTTGRTREAALSGKEIRPFTDLLLHDLGGGEGDVCTPQAGPGEYRTAPLWGLRHRSRYLHDGTATTLDGVLARHGGEAEAAARAFVALSAQRRDLLIRFLSSL